MTTSALNQQGVRYIFIMGGVMSGIGKGVATASIGKILQDKGFCITAIKIDPYVNVDAGTMNPVEHGEVFVTEDGIECDQDGGNYERFLDIDFSDANYITTGRVYQAVIERERNLGYNGKCVEVVPDIPNEVVSRIKRAGQGVGADFVLIEIGGTVGEYQNTLFLEAARMMKLRHPKKVLFILISYLPVPTTIGEMKTKPTQHAVKWLNMAGIQPDIILGRAKVAMDKSRKQKISLSCNLKEADVISAPDVDNIYKVPINFEKEKLGESILAKFGVKARKGSGLKEWKTLLKSIEQNQKGLRIGLVGKYFETGDFVLKDSYISVIEAVKHAGWACKRKPEMQWLSAEKYEKNKEVIKELDNYDGLIILGGFGERGVEGKIKVIEYARERGIPLFGLCLGLQLIVIEYARNVCGLKKAHSIEFAPDTKEPIIDMMLEQKNLLREGRYGGTMRLGAYKCALKKDTKAWNAYARKDIVSERHRHRYEVNNKYREMLESRGMVISGINPERDLVEIVELANHPFMLGTQFHPEFKSRPLRPHPLFYAFIKVCLNLKKGSE